MSVSKNNIIKKYRHSYLFCLPIMLGLGFDLYLWLSIQGLPIDDAYIYVKYIHNLTAGNGYSFNPGEVSFGATSFLFTIVCAAIHKTLPFVSVLQSCQMVGLISHAILLWLVQQIVYQQTKNRPVALLAGLTLALSRALYFTAPSGLETMFFNMLIVLFLWLGLNKIHPYYLGLVGGFLFLGRPEGLYFSIGFMGFIMLYPLLFAREQFTQHIKPTLLLIAQYMFSLLLITLPYLLFVKYHSGQWLPMTYYGKMLNRNLITTVEWYQRIYQGFRGLIQGYEQLIAQETFGFLLAALWMLTCLSLLVVVFQFARSKPAPIVFATRLAFFLFLLFPFVYGAIYRVAPLFGGFFIRYIQIVIILFHIEGFIALHHLLRGFALPQLSSSTQFWILRLPVLLLYPLLIAAMVVMFGKMKEDRSIYEGNVMVNETVRRQAAEWINENTPSDARIFTSNTGLGAIGAYTKRTIKDEAGLINKDIYPYLAAFQRNENHWHNMLEYMKVMELDYLTTFPPYGVEDRFLVPVHTIRVPELTGQRFEHVNELLIRKIEFPALYNLALDFAGHGDLIDRAPTPQTQGRAQVEQWEGQPSLTLQAQQAALDVRYKLMFPRKPVFTAALGAHINEAILSTSKDAEPLKLRFTVFANYEGQRVDLFEQVYTIEQSGPVMLDEIEVNLQAFSEKYGFMLFGVQLLSDITEPIAASFINPELRGG